MKVLVFLFLVLLGSPAWAQTVRYVNTASTSGGDGTTNATSGANRAYATLAAAVTGTRTISAAIEIYATGDNDGSTVNLNSTNNTSLLIDGQFSHRLVTTAYNTTITIAQPNVTLRRVECARTVNGTETFCLQIPWFQSNAGAVIEQSIWSHGTYASPDGGSALILLNSQVSGSQIFRNNFVFGAKSTNAVEVSLGESESTYIDNNTIIDSTGRGLYVYVGNTAAIEFAARNNIIKGSGTADYSISTGSTSSVITQTNLSSDATSPNIGLRNKSVTFTTAPQFDSSQTDLIDTGTTIGAFSTDIYGTTRPQGSAWDLGAFELGGGAPPSTDIYKKLIAAGNL